MRETSNARGLLRKTAGKGLFTNGLNSSARGFLQAQNLQSNPSAKRALNRFIDDSHTAVSKFSHDFEVFYPQHKGGSDYNMSECFVGSTFDPMGCRDASLAGQS